MNPPRHKSLKVLLLRCHQCAWYRTGRCICPMPGARLRSGEKCRRFRLGSYQVHAYAGRRYTGGKGSRPWMSYHPQEVYPC